MGSGGGEGSASVQDRDGAKTTLLSAYLFTPARFVYADAGFAGQLVDWCQRILGTTLRIVGTAPGQKGFAVISRRWVVERSLAWLTPAAIAQVAAISQMIVR